MEVLVIVQEMKGWIFHLMRKYGGLVYETPSYR